MENSSTSTLEHFYTESKQSNASEIYQLLEDIQDVCSASNGSIPSDPNWAANSWWQGDVVPYTNNIGSSTFIYPICEDQSSAENRYLTYCPTTIGFPHFDSGFQSYLVPQISQPSARVSHQSKVKHRAEISLVQTGRTQFKAIIKRKRKRTMFTTEQIQALEEVFKTKPYIIRKDREVLADRLQISDKSVKVWFQNRRLKGKRRPSTDSNESLLDYVESQITEKTDEFGYVTLDDEVMSDLVNVVDNILSNRVETSSTETSDTTSFGSSPIYEPISPASVTDNEDYNFSENQPYQYRSFSF